MISNLYGKYFGILPETLKSFESLSKTGLSYKKRPKKPGNIEVIGPLFRYENTLSSLLQCTTYEEISASLDEALSSDASEITLHINSPGGEIDGCFELCEKIRVLNTLKPIHAKISGYGCSAAYWIASACGDISATKTSIVGSLGVMAVLSPKEDGAHVFISSQTPLKNKDPETEEGACAVQQQIDSLCHVFFSEVAKNRNTSLEIVSSQYGMGASFVGEQALKSGLIDRIEEHEFYPEKKRFHGNEKALRGLSAFVDMEKNEADEIFGLIKKFGV